jgi:hypothetical protein
MDLQAEKLDLIQWLVQLSDENLIRKISALRNEKNSSVDQSKNYSINEAHQSILEERIKSHEYSPESGSDWKEVKKRITSK